MVGSLLPVLVQAWLVTIAFEWGRRIQLEGAWETCIQLCDWGIGCCVMVDNRVLSVSDNNDSI